MGIDWKGMRWLAPLTDGAAVLAIFMAASHLAGHDPEPIRHDGLLALSYLDARVGASGERSVIVSDGSPVVELIRQRDVSARQDRETPALTTPDPRVIRAHLSDGDTVYSPRGARTALELQGFRFERIPVDLTPTKPADQPGEVAAAGRELFTLYRLVRAERCIPVSSRGLTDITNLASGGRISGTLDPGTARAAELVIYVARARPMRPRLTAISAQLEPLFIVERVRAGTEDDSALHAALARGGIASPRRAERDDLVYRVALRPSAASGEILFRIDLGGLPRWAIASVPAAAATWPSATLCAAPPSEDELFGDRTQAAPIRLGSQTLFGDGWHSPERVGTADEFRWTAAPEAELLVPLARSGPVRLRIRARSGAPAESAGTLAVRVNGHQLPAHPLRRRVSQYDWIIPAAALRAGVNQVFLQSSQLTVPARVGDSRDGRRLGVRVSGVTLELLNGAP